MAENYDYAPKEKDSDEQLGKITYANIDMANNGFVVCFSVLEKKPGMKDNDHCWPTEKKYLFTEEQEDEAWEYYKKIKMKEMKG